MATRTGPAVRARKGDTRPHLVHETPPQTKKRTMVSTSPSWEEADWKRADLEQRERIDGDIDRPLTYQVRKNKHGYGVYRREAIK